MSIVSFSFVNWIFSIVIDRSLGVLFASRPLPVGTALSGLVPHLPPTKSVQPNK
jgi:hypothetical protein